MPKYHNGHAYSAEQMENEKRLLQAWFQGIPAAAEGEAEAYVQSHPVQGLGDDIIPTALRNGFIAGFMAGSRAGARVISAEMLERGRQMEVAR